MGYKLKRATIRVNGVEKQVRPTGIQWNGDLSKISTATTFTVASPIQILYSLYFKPDGSKFYVAGYKGVGTGRIQQYSMSTPRDITTATNEVNIDFGTANSSYGNYPLLLFGNEGNYLYFYDNPISNRYLRVYTLGTAWDLNSTKTSLTNYSGKIAPLWLSEDGKTFIWSNESIFQTSVSGTAWSINTSGTQIGTGANFGGAKMSKDGNYLYLLTGSKVLTKYSLATPGSPSSTRTQEQQVSIAGREGLCFDTYGNNMYAVDGTTIYQYSLV